MNAKAYICNGKLVLQNRLLGYNNKISKFDNMFLDMIDKFCEYNMCYDLLCKCKEEIEDKFRLHG